MVVYEFCLEDLARTRFAISPMWEAVASLRLLLQPSRAAMHLPWVSELRDGRLSGLDLRAAAAMLPPRGYIPDFLTPPPSDPLVEFADELEAVRATPPDQVRTDLGFLLGRRRPPALLKPFLDDPGAAVGRLADALDEYWRLAVEPHWPRIRSLLESDIAYRAGRLTAGGQEALFADLHPAVVWNEPQLEVHQEVSCEPADLRGEGLLLVPSAFGWERVASITDPPWQPTLIYPARGVAMLWEPGEPAPDGLAALVGRTRAELLVELDAPSSTTELAHCMGVSVGGVSQHLSVLREAGLVTGRREGRSVLYCRTPLADSLVGP
jgi:DNA-binding transcriptional ArsR family regulator